MRACSEKDFLAAVVGNEMTIIRDLGVDRHIRFKKSNTFNCHFDLITWPGHLCITGDMGTYVFARIRDMFEFFRTDRKHNPYIKPGETLYINLGYWSEKILAADKNGKIEEYDADLARAKIVEWLDQMGASEDLRQAVREDVLAYAEDGEYAIRQAADDFHYEGTHDVFQDFFEVDLKDYTYSFVWNCYAIAWGLVQYDKMIAEVEANCYEKEEEKPS